MINGTLGVTLKMKSIAPEIYSHTASSQAKIGTGGMDGFAAGIFATKSIVYSELNKIGLTKYLAFD